MSFEHPRQWCHLRSGSAALLSSEVFGRDEAQVHVVWLGADDRVDARCSLWWRHTPTLGGQRIGAIGHYAADDLGSGAALLEAACTELTEAGCALAVGPMDGNTWRGYRLVTERGQAPRFFLEPAHPDEWPAHFTNAGFTLFAGYRSSVCEDVGFCDGRVRRHERRLAENGISLRTLAIDRLQAELQAIHDVSIDAFKGAFLYQPIGFESLHRQYQPLADLIDPSLVLLAQREEEVVGFAFGVPDLCQATRGERVDTAVLKTLAVRPQRAFSGLGLLLMQRFHDAARGRGMRRVIHAMMHEGNQPILALSARYAQPMRRYGLFARALR